MYDLNTILDYTDVQEVAESIGLRTMRKGKNIYCECPSHRKVLGKDDSNIGNCVLTRRGYVCFACGAKGDAFSMVMDYCNLNFPEAVKRVAHIAGVSYLLTDDKKEIGQKPPFSSSELELIGLTSVANPKGDAGKEILGVSSYRPVSEAFFRRGDEYVTYSSTKRITLNQLFQEDPTLYYELVMENATIAIRKYKRLCELIDRRGSEDFIKTFGVFFTNGVLDEAIMVEIKNVLIINVRMAEKILKEAEKKGEKQ